MATTTVMYQGHNGHSSSRVLAPPGGKSSVFLFGGSDDAAKPAKPAKAAAPAATAAAIFDGPENRAMAAKPASASNPHAVPAAAVYSGPLHPRLTSNLAAGAAPATTAATKTAQAPAAAEGKTRDVFTSSRVLNPPGGKSSIAFF
jgi:hypothetical protein